VKRQTRCVAIVANVALLSACSGHRGKTPNGSVTGLSTPVPGATIARSAGSAAAAASSAGPSVAAEIAQNTARHLQLVAISLLAAILIGVVAFLHSIPAGILVVVFFIVYQQVENHILQPVIYGRTVQLSPLAVLVSILIGAELAGILESLLP